MSEANFMVLVDRMKLLLSTGEDADVHFLVGEGDGEKLLPAHKLILKTASDVFGAMFRYDSTNEKAKNVSSDSVVSVPDVCADAFSVLLSFIYTDNVSGLNGDNATEVIYAGLSDKYNISGLIKPCLNIPISELRNVFMAYGQARLFELEEYAQQCLLYIDENAETLLKSEEFLGIDQEMLCKILERDQLKIKGEISIWEPAIRWANWQCRKNVKECSVKNCRSVLGPALFKIRFPLIPKEDFSTKIFSSGMLTNEEVFGVYQYHCHPNLRDGPGLYPLRFSTQERFSYRKEGTLTMEIDKLSEFAKKEVYSRRYSQNAIFIGGVPWKIMAQPTKKSDESTEKCLGIFLFCTAPKEDTIWSCKCSATIRIVSQKHEVEDLTRKFNHIFNAKSTSWGFRDLITFTNLMNVAKGLYNGEEDKVTLAIDVSDVAIIT